MLKLTYPTFPYIDYSLLYQYISRDSKDAQSIRKLLKEYFKDIKLYGYVQTELYYEADKIAKRNGININNLIKGDLEYYT
jgi:hypothetical protein